jgi:hypothetical protein
MKIGVPRFVAVAVVANAAVLLEAPCASATESPSDVETDHIQAFDDVGPRSFAVLASSGGEGLGRFGAKMGGELDFGLSDAMALSIDGGWLLSAHEAGYGVAIGTPVFLARVPFHGLYVQPRVSLAHRAIDGVSIDTADVGATLGWQWTLREGLTLRLGVGVAYGVRLSDAGGPGEAFAGLEPLADAGVGWVF